VAQVITLKRAIRIPDGTPESIVRAISAAGRAQFCRFTGDLTQVNALKYAEYSIDAEIGPARTPIGAAAPPTYRVRFLIPVDFPYRPAETVPLDPPLKWYPHQMGDYPPAVDPHANIICPPRLLQVRFDALLHPYIRHAYQWITDALGRGLAPPDEPYEFPHIVRSAAKMFFVENGHRLREYLERSGCGRARVVRIGKGKVAPEMYRVTSVWDCAGAQETSSGIREDAFGPEEYAGWSPWVFIGDPVVEKPHRPLISYDDFSPEVKRRMLAAARSAAEQGQILPVFLLAFVVPETWGGKPELIVWQAADAAGMDEKTFAPPKKGGFRPGGNCCLWPAVRKLKRQMMPLSWFTCTDVAEEALTARGALRGEMLDGLNVAIVGLGAVGSMMAKSMSKLSPAALTLIDNERLEPGNLVRHEAYACHVGTWKATAMATLVSPLMTDHNVSVFACDVRQVPEDGEKNLDLCHMVVDASADEGVHQFLADWELLREKRLVWCYVTPGPDFGVLVLRRPGSRLSCRRAEESLASKADALWSSLTGAEKAPGRLVWPEPGCYHPTFRASYHRVSLMTHSFLTTILAWLASGCPCDLVTVFQQNGQVGQLGLETRIVAQFEV